MSYFIVPVNNSELDIDYRHLIEGIQISDTNCYVKLGEEVSIKNTWQAITEEEFNQIKVSINTPPETV